MSRRLLRAAAATLRVSLLGAGGALGLLALSAGTASADNGEHGLLGSLAPALESVVAPVDPLVHNLTGPLTLASDAGAPSGGSGLIGSAPLIGEDLSVAAALTPVTRTVDATLAQVPVVNSLVPSGTATSLTQPLLAGVDSAVAPLHEALTPVVTALDPVVSPVADVLDPVVDQLAPVAPGSGAGEVDVLDPVLIDGVPGSPSAAGLPSGPGTDAAETAESLLAGSLASESASMPPLSGPVDSPVGASAAAMRPSGVWLYGSGSQPLMAPVPSPLTDPGGLPAVSAGAGAAAAGSSGSGGKGAAAVTPSSFHLDLSSLASVQSGYSASLQLGPAFDPGSTPD